MGKTLIHKMWIKRRVFFNPSLSGNFHLNYYGNFNWNFDVNFDGNSDGNFYGYFDGNFDGNLSGNFDVNFDKNLMRIGFGTWIGILTGILMRILMIDQWVCPMTVLTASCYTLEHGDILDFMPWLWWGPATQKLVCGGGFILLTQPPSHM